MVYRLNPLQDPRWTDLVERHPLASVFHTPAWLDALRRTYGYEPVAFTTAAPGTELTNGIVFCQVRSWMTGCRLVSLPFSDHCEPLLDDYEQLVHIVAHLQEQRRANGWNYVELRPQQMRCALPGLIGFEQYNLHTLNLEPEPDALFRSFHRSSVQRKIRRASREGLAYEEGNREELLRAFYRLLVHTRKRHQLPPQPYEWFANLASCLGNALKIRVASHHGHSIAAILTLRHRRTVVYKYGASDAAFHSLGGMHLLFWTTIQNERAEGCVTFDMGRSDCDNAGLIAFKERWGARRMPITYCRCPASPVATSMVRRYVRARARRALALAPERVRVVAGRMLYKHVG
jgi:CelD/BcsL family acetyltransferase involved in cellulose biosynthesis